VQRAALLVDVVHLMSYPVPFIMNTQ
jgi:hypothetical protein